MIPIRQFDALLQTQSLNNKMFQTLVQGSEDTAIKATIQQDGKNIQIDTSAEIELSVLYNGGTTQTYHTDQAKSDFPATIESDGTLIIKFNEMMTTVFGTHKLFLKIVDTNTSYALAMDYTVIKNEAYNPQSTPNNLPAYNTLVAELPKKLNKDFSNADDVALKNKLSTLGIGADETPEQIRDKLQTLKADARLDSSEVAGSHYATTIEAQRTTPKNITSPKFTFSVKANETYRFYGKSNKDDGFYLQTSTVANPLIRFDYEFEELSEVIKLALDDAFSKTNEIKFVKADGEEVTNKILVYNVDDGKFKLEDNA